MLTKTMKVMKQRAIYFTDLVNDLTEEDVSQQGGERDQDSESLQVQSSDERKGWIENESSNVFVRKVCSK